MLLPLPFFFLFSIIEQFNYAPNINAHLSIMLCHFGNSKQNESPYPYEGEGQRAAGARGGVAYEHKKSPAISNGASSVARDNYNLSIIAYNEFGYTLRWLL